MTTSIEHPLPSMPDRRPFPDLHGTGSPWWPVTLFILIWFSWAVYGALGSTVNPFETGVYLNGGNRVLEGERVYTDFFSIYGAGTYYLFAIPQFFTHNTVYASQSIFLAMALACAVTAACVARRLTNSCWLQILASFSAIAYSSGGFRLVFVLGGLIAIARYLEHRKSRWLVVAGALAAVNLMVQQDMAAYALAAFGLEAAAIALLAPGPDTSSFWIRILRLCSAVTLGFAGVAIVWMLFMTTQGTALSYIHDAFVVTLRHYDTLPMRTIPPPWKAPPLKAGVVSMWARFGLDGPFRWFFFTLPFYWVPGLCFATVAIAFAKLRKSNSPSNSRVWANMLAIALLGSFMSRTIIHTGDEIKLSFNSLPAAILAIGWIAIASRKGHRRSAIAMGLMLLCFQAYPIVQRGAK